MDKTRTGKAVFLKYADGGPPILKGPRCHPNRRVCFQCQGHELAADFGTDALALVGVKRTIGNLDATILRVSFKAGGSDYFFSVEANKIAYPFLVITLFGWAWTLARKKDFSAGS